MKLDILAFGAHPDDVELGAGATLAKHAAQGYKTGIIDLTFGEMGTRGTPEIRLEEANVAAKILGCSIRENLGLRDGFLVNDENSQLEVIKMIRKYQPDIVICNAPKDRHPDHGIASSLVVESCFKAGLRKLVTELDGLEQEAWRPKSIFHYLQYYALDPDLIVDTTNFYGKKEESILAHKSQFYNPDSKEPETVIASKGFIDSIEGRSREYGRLIYKEHGEGFISEEVIKVDDLTKLK